MKKSLTAAVVAGLLAMSAGSVFANPVELNGDVSLHWRTKVQTAGNKHEEGSKFTFRLNAQTALVDNLDLYARFAAQRVSDNLVGADFNSAAYPAGTDTVADIDQFGLIYKGKGYTAKIGRQDLVIGATGLIYDSTGDLGKHRFTDGVTVSGKSGVTNYSLVAVQADGTNIDGDKDDKYYSVAASYNPVKNLTLGTTLAKVKFEDDSDDVNFWAVNAAYNFGKATYSAEYAKSNEDDNNKAYDFGVNYAFDNKNSVSATYSRVESPNWGRTGFDAGEKGMYYSFSHKVTKDSTVSLFYKNMSEVNNSDNKDNSFRTTYTVKF